MHLHSEHAAHRASCQDSAPLRHHVRVSAGVVASVEPGAGLVDVDAVRGPAVVLPLLDAVGIFVPIRLVPNCVGGTDDDKGPERDERHPQHKIDADVGAGVYWSLAGEEHAHDAKIP